MEKVLEIEESAVDVEQGSVSNVPKRNRNELPEGDKTVKQSTDVPLTGAGNGNGVQTEKRSGQSQEKGSVSALVTGSATPPSAAKGASGEDSYAARAYLFQMFMILNILFVNQIGFV